MGEGIEERNPARSNFSFAEAARFWELSGFGTTPCLAHLSRCG